MTRALIAFLCDNFTIFSNFDLPQGEGVKSRTPKARRGEGRSSLYPPLCTWSQDAKKIFWPYGTSTMDRNFAKCEFREIFSVNFA